MWLHVTSCNVNVSVCVCVWLGKDSLCLIAQCGAVDIAQHLLFCNNKSNLHNNVNQSVKMPTLRKFNPLIEAIRNGHDVCARALISSCAQGTCDGNDEAHTTHHTMIHEKGTFHWNQLNLALTADIDRSLFPSTVTPLMAAAIMNKTDMVALLLQTGYSIGVKNARFSVHTVDNRGFRAAVYACLFGSLACVQKLLEYEARCHWSRGETDDVHTSESLLETVALARSFFFRRDRDKDTEKTTESNSKADSKDGDKVCPYLGTGRFPETLHSSYLQSCPLLIRTGCATMTHKFLRRIVSSEQFGFILNETKHLDSNSKFTRGAGGDSDAAVERHGSMLSSPSERKNPSASVWQGTGLESSDLPSRPPLSTIVSDTVVQWHPDVMPYADVVLAVSLSGGGAGCAHEPDKLVTCHSFILMQHSTCFERMFGAHRHMLRIHSTDGCSVTRRLDMFTSSYRSVDQMLCWMYHGIDVTASASMDLFSSVSGGSVSGGGGKTQERPFATHLNADTSDTIGATTAGFCTCIDIQELVDLLLLANEFLITRLQRLCEHRIGLLLAEYPLIDANSEAYTALSLQLRELGEAFNFTILLSYWGAWSDVSSGNKLSGEGKMKNKRSKKKKTDLSHSQLREKQQLGYLDNKNSDFPFLLHLLLARVLGQEESQANMFGVADATHMTTRYLESFLSSVTSYEDNFYAQTFCVVDVLVEAFPIVLMEEGPEVEDEFPSHVPNLVAVELGCFHVHNKWQRLYILQSLLLVYFSSLLEFALFVVESTEADTDAAAVLAGRLSNKLYWFCKRHVLLLDMSVEVESNGAVSNSHTVSEPMRMSYTLKGEKGEARVARDLLLLLDSGVAGGGEGESESESEGVWSNGVDTATTMTTTLSAFCVHRAVVAVCKLCCV